jgi:transcriptional regulator with XRE-family HTH domain
MTHRRSATVRRRRLGKELRRLREAAGLTIERVAQSLECSDSKISRIETGLVGATPRDVRDMLELYGSPEEQRDKLMQAARDAREKGWWHAYRDVRESASLYIGLEAAADQIQTYEALLIPGLLQTTAYARTVINVLYPDVRPHEVDRWIEFREVRQALLRQDDPPAIWAILDEGSLRRPVGGWEIMRRQLQRLIEVSVLDTVTLQVLPLQVGEHAAMHGSFTILGFRDLGQLDGVFLENAAGDLYLDSDKELRWYKHVFDRLQASALDPGDSAAWLAELRAEL